MEQYWMPGSNDHLACYERKIIYNREKTASSINSAGKTGQLHVKEWN